MQAESPRPDTRSGERLRQWTNGKAVDGWDKVYGEGSGSKRSVWYHRVWSQWAGMWREQLTCSGERAPSRGATDARLRQTCCGRVDNGPASDRLEVVRRLNRYRSKHVGGLGAFAYARVPSPHVSESLQPAACVKQGADAAALAVALRHTSEST